MPNLSLVSALSTNEQLHKTLGYCSKKVSLFVCVNRLHQLYISCFPLNKENNTDLFDGITLTESVMADPLSITASILAVVVAGFKAAKGLYQLADGIGSAGMEARIYAEEINSFSKLLQRTREQITQRSEQISSFEETLLREIINICDRVIRPINGIQESLNPILVRFRSSPSKLRSFGLRVQWMFCSKDKLLFYRGALRGQHRLLDTTLALMILQYTKDRSPQNI